MSGRESWHCWFPLHSVNMRQFVSPVTLSHLSLISSLSRLPSSPSPPSAWPPPRTLWWPSPISTLEPPPAPSPLPWGTWSPLPRATDLWLWRDSQRTSTRTGWCIVRVSSTSLTFSPDSLIPSARLSRSSTPRSWPPLPFSTLLLLP